MNQPRVSVGISVSFIGVIESLEDGEKTIYDKKGNIRHRYTISNGDIGEIKTFYPNGNIMKRGFHDIKTTRTTGEFIWYEENGEIYIHVIAVEGGVIDIVGDLNDKLRFKYTMQYGDIQWLE